VLVFQSSSYGKVLVLDGVIQVTEKDEMAYQEMIAHIPLFAHPNPETVRAASRARSAGMRSPRARVRELTAGSPPVAHNALMSQVLIVGGGDGGVLREVCRHRGVRSITMCEIDEEVVNVAKTHFGHLTATSFEDARLELLFEDAAEFVRRRDNHFDVVIVDSSDPVGPAESLFTSDFYAALRKSLKPGGIICNQGECQWLHLDLIQKVLGDCGQTFATVEYAFTTIPSYPCGQIGFLLCSLSDATDMLRKPRRRVEPEMQAQLRYYSPAVHRAAFVLPEFAERVIAPLRKNRARLVSNTALAACAAVVASAACTLLLARRR
jgi:spermidine synthase